MPTMRKFKNNREDFVFLDLAGARCVARASRRKSLHSFDLLWFSVNIRPGSPAGCRTPRRAGMGRMPSCTAVLWASRVAGRYEQGVDPVDLAASSLGAYVRPETVTALRRAIFLHPGVGHCC